MATILQNPFFVEIILPFILVFTVVFAVLQKAQILGKDKNQVDALVALTVGLIFVSFAWATDIVVSLIPFLVVSLVVILIFMLLAGMLFQPGKFELHKNIRFTVIGIVAVALVIAVLVVTNAWDYLLYLFEGEGGGDLQANVVFIVVIVAGIAAVLFGAKKSGSGGDDD
jgi:hypothetical protein